MVDNETTSLTRVDFDPATFTVSWLFEEILKETVVSVIVKKLVCVYSDFSGK